MVFKELGDTTYIALETFKKNGQGVSTPVWVIGKEGKLYVWTDGDSWKVKRIENNSSVRVCKCDVRGSTESDWIEADARILREKKDDEEMRKHLAKKYGLKYQFFNLMGKVTRKNSSRVIIELSESI